MTKTSLDWRVVGNNVIAIKAGGTSPWWILQIKRRARKREADDVAKKGLEEMRVIWAEAEYAGDDGELEQTWEPLANLTDCEHALVEFYASDLEATCRLKHKKRGFCRCHLPVWKIGQDESIFKAFARQSRMWTYNGIVALRKKTEGPGRMVSAVQDEIRGFGYPMTAGEVVLVNAWRLARYGKTEEGTPVKPDLAGSPGVRFLDYGAAREGYWTYEHFKLQMEDLLDCHECLHPGFQFVMEVDWSSGHAAHRSGALNANTMNVGFGGKQTVPHPSVMTAGCLGANNPTLKEGDVQHFSFQDGERPWYKAADGTDYAGLPKGMKQVLWERGLWKEGMVEKIPEDDLLRDQSMSMRYVLSECEDFRNEITALQELFRRRGHMCIMSPKGHPELAGEGIEYSWGKQKKFFRRSNKCEMKEFCKLILQSMSGEVLPLSTVRKFARKARAYKEAYRTGVADGRAFVDIERMIKTYKAHRNAVDFHGHFINAS